MTGKRVSEMTDDEVREMATGISRDYFDLMNHLRDVRAALGRAEDTLDLIGPNDLPRHVALDDLVVGIQTSADLIGRRTGTNERERAAQSAPGMLAPDAVATYAAMLEATEPDPAPRAAATARGLADLSGQGRLRELTDPEAADDNPYAAD